MALAHDERDQTEGAYLRSDFLDKRRALMMDWAKFLTSKNLPISSGYAVNKCVSVFLL